jgi:hypothetical protein
LNNLNIFSTLPTFKEKFSYIKALAGAGKTYTMIHEAVKRAARTRQKFVIIQPTVLLVEESFWKAENAKAALPEFEQRRIKISRIHGDESDSVSVDIKDHLEDSIEGTKGEVLLITQQSFLKLPYFPGAKSWTLVVDEVIQLDTLHSFHFQKFEHIINDNITVSPFDDNHYLVTATNITELERIAASRHKETAATAFANFANDLLSPHMLVLCKKSQWDKLLTKDDGEDSYTLDYHSALLPSAMVGFKEVIFMSAMFDESLIHVWWSRLGVEFNQHSLSHILTEERHSFSGRVKILCYTEDLHWSKSLMDTKAADGRFLIDHYISAIEQRMKGKDYLWAANNDLDEHTSLTLKGRRMPVLSHGLNCYDDRSHIAFLCALNRTPSQYSFLASIGIEDHEVDRATACAAAYQSVMRSSLRNRNSTEQTTIIVPDLTTAAYLYYYFDCDLDDFEYMTEFPRMAEPKKNGRPTIGDEPMTAAERKRRSREKQKAKKAA